jgi:FAD/FMN-containing dehydrogenase
MRMPEPDQAVLARKDEIVAALRRIVPGEGVVTNAEELRAYESDGLTAYRQPPFIVVLPETTEEVSRVLSLCLELGVKVVPRGAGTSLSGGALPLADGVVLGLGKFNRILEVDFDNRCVVAQPGVTNLAITQAVEHADFYYAPDPSSQIACTIGGNVAENSGGVHCLKYGLTTNNLLGLEMVLMDGTVIKLGGKHLDAEGYDLLGLMTGSEGLLGVVTEVTVRILKSPETARALLFGFPTSDGDAVAAIIGAGIIPGGMEMMDRPAIHAAEDFVHAGYPLDVEALLIVELDGPQAEVDHLIAKVSQIAEKEGASTSRVSQNEAERRGRAPDLLGRAQGGLSGRGPDLAGLLLHGRHDPPGPAAQGAEAHARDVRALRPALRQRVPCRRRQPAPADPLRRQRAGRAGDGRGLRRGLDRRARRRGREARPHGRDVHRGRSEPAATGQVRLRSQFAAEPGQDVPEPSSLRRAGPHARPPRRAEIPGPAKVLSGPRLPEERAHG